MQLGCSQIREGLLRVLILSHISQGFYHALVGVATSSESIRGVLKALTNRGL